MWKPDTHMVYGIYKGAGAKCDHQRIGVRARVRANIDLDVRGACVRRKKRFLLELNNFSYLYCKLVVITYRRDLI